MANKQWELQTSLLMTELLYLSEDFKEYIKKSDLVQRTTKAKIITVVEDFAAHHQSTSYVRVNTTELNLGNHDIMHVLLANTIISKQVDALHMFTDACLAVLEGYSNKRVTVNHYVSLVEDNIAHKVINLMSAFINNRNKIQQARKIVAETQKESKTE